jgi:hypothetical protein
MGTTPPGVQPITMGVQEAEVAQACRRRDKSGWGKEGVLGQGGGSGNNGGNVIVHWAGGG